MLSQLKSFLPKLAQANEDIKDLKEEDKAKLDIEHLESEDASYVQMNLALAPTEAMEGLEDVLCDASASEKLKDKEDDDEEEHKGETQKKKRKLLIEEL